MCIRDSTWSDIVSPEEVQGDEAVTSISADRLPVAEVGEKVDLTASGEDKDGNYADNIPIQATVDSVQITDDLQLLNGQIPEEWEDAVGEDGKLKENTISYIREGDGVNTPVSYTHLKRCDSSDSGSGTDQEAKRGEGRGSEMKKMYKIATVLLAFCFLLGSVPMSVKAEDYTYKVTIYSGKQGTFTGIPGNLVKENNATVSISDDKSAIVIDKLNPNDSVNMSELLTSVSLGSNSKYYVRGIKESGRCLLYTSWRW